MDFESYAAHIEDAAALGLSGDAYSMLHHLAHAAGLDCASFVAQQAVEGGLEEGVYKSIAAIAATWQTTPAALIAAAASAGVPPAEYAEQIAAGTAAPPPANAPPAAAALAPLAEDGAAAAYAEHAGEQQWAAEVGGAAAAAPAAQTYAEEGGSYAATEAAPPAAAGYYAPPPAAQPQYAPPSLASAKSKALKKTASWKKRRRVRGKKGKFSCADPTLAAAWHGVKDDFNDANWFLMSYESTLGAFDRKDVALLGQGSGGFPEMVGHLANDRIIWGGFRCTAMTGHHEIPKYVFITWVGSDIPSTRAAVVGTETHLVRAAFRGSHHTVRVSLLLVCLVCWTAPPRTPSVGLTVSSSLSLSLSLSLAIPVDVRCRPVPRPSLPLLTPPPLCRSRSATRKISRSRHSERTSSPSFPARSI